MEGRPWIGEGGGWVSNVMGGLRRFGLSRHFRDGDGRGGGSHQASINGAEKDGLPTKLHLARYRFELLMT